MTGVGEADVARELDSSPSGVGLQRAEMQQVIFAERPSRAALLALPALPAGKSMTIRVHRNHGFELAEQPLRRFLEYAGYAAVVETGAYDDSFSFADATSKTDVEIVWIDLSRYAQGAADDAVTFLVDRISALRTLTDAPILVVPLGGENSVELPERATSALGAVGGVRVGNLSRVQQFLGPKLIDNRTSAHTGTRLSGPALVAIAREMGLSWIPSLVGPPVKAVAIDLDHTLYAGVLGEDGAYGVTLTDGHRRLQRALAQLANDGLFVVVVSKNDPADVEELFEVRKDFPLRREYLSGMAVSWSPKAAGIAQLADQLRIAPDAFLFIDDNPGELAAVAAALPGIRTLYAAPGGDATTLALQHYPHLFRWQVDETDRSRVRDIRAARERDAMATASADPDDYLRALEATVTVTLNGAADVRRLFEMSHKTNQFNLAMARLPEATVAARASGQGGVVAVRLKDRLSDSGVIASIIGRAESRALVIEDLCVSCRALGRNLEDLMISTSIRALMVALDCDRVRLTYRAGPRNAPARNWLQQFSGKPVSGQELTVEMTAGQVASIATAAAARPVTLVVNDG